ncbi:hypothetical protein SAY87_008090 [Trapa incisa]|uniref:DNA-(apurinic or apyrimidinic site) endonuclease n=1 Tax=Trapa incisa TaxID=236973 RepID=A0AAN7KKP1_9MYRT|nr:hypothetical protein SAY87_008090 [Trapa incisa]
MGGFWRRLLLHSPAELTTLLPVGRSYLLSIPAASQGQSLGGSSVSFRTCSAVSKMPLRSTAKPITPATGEKLSKEEDQNSCESLVLENGVGHSHELLGIKDDLKRIDNMTCQELRTTLRKAGIPAKGRKSDLISALKNYMDEKTKDEGSQAAEEQISSVNAGCVSVAKGDEFQLESEISTSDQLQLTRKEETSGRKLGGSKRKLSSQVPIEEVGTVMDVDKAIDNDEPWAILAHKKPQKHWVPYNPGKMRPPCLSSDTKSVKLMSWNVNGLRALLKKKGFSALELAQREDFDVLCLQETKLQEKDIEAIKDCLIEGYGNSFWTCSVSKLGYSGTAIISRIKPISVTYGLGTWDHDNEGRLVTAEFDSFYLLSAYVPNSGDGLRRLQYRTTEWDPSLGSYLKELERSKPVILTGDLNCAHQEIDIYNPAGNKRSAGFTIEERQSFEANFLSKGFVDTFRMQHPNAVGYTYWGYRHGGRKTNKGWRLDYFLVSESIADDVHDSYILPHVTGSDHCPIGLILKL